MEMPRSILGLIAASMLLAADRPRADPAQSLAGRYYSQFADGLVTGERYTGENIVEIVPVAPHAAYVRLHLDYYNGHTCGIYGVAISKGDSLTYRDPKQESTGCILTVRRLGKSLSIDDGARSCSSYCGARGSLSRVTLPYASKRPIRYLARLKQSRQYGDALKEWRTSESR